jgi:hypothetical protein
MITSSIFAQKTVSKVIYKQNYWAIKLMAFYVYNERNELEGIYTVFYAKDFKYESLNEYMVAFEGKPAQMVAFLNAVKKFNEENEPGTTMKIMGHSVSLDKNAFGVRPIYIWDEDHLLYHIIFPDRIDKILIQFLTWANQNNIQY